MSHQTVCMYGTIHEKWQEIREEANRLVHRHPKKKTSEE